ncbi:MAG: hypothetical protein C4519_26830 [Desulfobacteraceae bacterium]|nr:MAG: hypothetical protein C4519_26830 [Desulfobacteraceae bacterium]
MKKMPSRDTSGHCKGECRDRAFEARQERQRDIHSTDMDYSTPAENSPSWSRKRNAPPGWLGGRV